MFASLGGCCPTLSEAKPCEPSKATADRTKTLELFICVSPFMVFCGAPAWRGNNGDPYSSWRSSSWNCFPLVTMVCLYLGKRRLYQVPHAFFRTLRCRELLPSNSLLKNPHSPATLI